jgi:hypothetical protein
MAGFIFTGSTGGQWGVGEPERPPVTQEDLPHKPRLSYENPHVVVLQVGIAEADLNIPDCRV